MNSQNSTDFNIVNEGVCHFGDSFRISVRKDSLFLLEILCNMPNGKQINSRTMLTRESILKLKELIEKMTDHRIVENQEEAPTQI